MLVLTLVAIKFKVCAAYYDIYIYISFYDAWVEYSLYLQLHQIGLQY